MKHTQICLYCDQVAWVPFKSHSEIIPGTS